MVIKSVVKNIWKIIIGLMILPILTPTHAAVIVTPDSAFTTSVSLAGFSVEETIDGITTESDNGFVINGSGFAGNFDYGFSSEHDISGFHLFNDAGSQPNEGISGFNLIFYNNTGSLITSVTGLVTDTSKRLTGPDEYSFSTIFGVKSVTLEVLGSYDESELFGNELAFREVQFIAETSPVPVPAAVWLFSSGLVGLIGIARRKKA